jgi:DNA-binding NarL/FixJ family response regulator
MRAALERASIPVVLSGRLADDVLDGLRLSNAAVVIVDAGSTGEALPWVRRVQEVNVVRRILVVAGAVEEDSDIAVLEAGAQGTVHDDASLAQLVRAIRSSHPAVTARMMSLVGDRIHALASELRRATATTETLTDRQSQVLRLLSLGLSNKDIARELGIWTQTVKTHLHNIYAKLGARSRREAVTRALRLGLLREKDGEEPPSRSEDLDPIELAVQAVKGSRPKRVAAVGRAVTELEQRLASLEPRSFRAGGSVAELLAAIDASAPAVEEFIRLADAVAGAADPGVALALYKALHGILERYGPSASGGRFDPRDFDFYRFTGHEMVVTLVAALLGRRRWSAVGDLLDQRLIVANAAGWHSPHAVSFGYASDLLEALDEAAEKRGVLSVHAQLLEARHGSGPLARVSFDDFVAADYFLFLRGELSGAEAPQNAFEWRPWSTAVMRTVPWFIRDAAHVSLAEDLAAALRVESVEELRSRLIERAPRLDLLWRSRAWESPITAATLERVGTVKE